MIMRNQNIDELKTREVAKAWFEAQSKGDAETGMDLMDSNIEWINYTIIPGMNDIMPWIGTYHGIEEVVKSWQIFIGLIEPKLEEVVELVVEGESAIGIIHEVSVVKETGKKFEIEFVQWLKIHDGKIVRWKSYTDPSSIILAMQGD